MPLIPLFLDLGTAAAHNTYFVCSATDDDVLDLYVQGVKVATFEKALITKNVAMDITNIVKYENAFTFTLTAGQSTASVSFPTAFTAASTPVVVCTPPYTTSFWITSITNTGFTFNVGTTNAYNQTINCIAMETT